MIELIDTHAHLDFPDYNSDLPAVLERALQAGVIHIITVGFDLPSSRSAVSLADRYPMLSAAVGVHPHEAQGWDQHLASEIAALAQHPKVVAIGETGLDYYRNKSPREAQLAAFRAHLDIAEGAGLPVIVHDREAHEEVNQVLLNWSQSTNHSDRPARKLGVVHCFSGDGAMALHLLDAGYYISFAGPLTYPKAEEKASLAQDLPLSGLLVETDSPYLAPQQRRGRRNEPAYVLAVAEKLAALKSVLLADVAAATTANAKALFGLK